MGSRFSSPVSEALITIYQKLFDHFGPQGWWPGDSPFEVCIGSILTQNTNWTNVEKAMENLKESGLVSPLAIHETSIESLAEAIRPAGYYNIKAGRLKNFVNFLMEQYHGDLELMFASGLERLRSELLGIKGIGPETADSILLYAGNLPSFVVDAYTLRALSRHDIIYEDSGYEEVRELFMENLPPDPDLFNEFHALWVALGKTYCKKSNPSCSSCPLKSS